MPARSTTRRRGLRNPTKGAGAKNRSAARKRAKHFGFATDSESEAEQTPRKMRRLDQIPMLDPIEAREHLLAKVIPDNASEEDVSKPGASDGVSRSASASLTSPVPPQTIAEKPAEGPYVRQLFARPGDYPMYEDSEPSDTEIAASTSTASVRLTATRSRARRGDLGDCLDRMCGTGQGGTGEALFATWGSLKAQTETAKIS
ncbi:Uu.00g145750.m01.CDS01 [Anthostomella pinea]|uniref:Uu.00g145750.m01.CDS01 n=1 Tax=Anthostomella pinea TaxID=933095 RepID=A0AAI8VRR9_9PEZI|nr:Uu.00g145750.m01.CDS01 [Anthostomella pinea]